RSGWACSRGSHISRYKIRWRRTSGGLSCGAMRFSDKFGPADEPARLPAGEPPGDAEAAVPVAAYVRMSTDHQQYSTQNQLDRIQTYARQLGLHITRVFADEGKSGLDFNRRNGLRHLTEAVESRTTEFVRLPSYGV